MKNSIKTLIASFALTTIILTGSAFTSKATENNTTTVLTNVKKVSKITVSGNVELILVQSGTESVKVYDSYYGKNALVQQKGGELRISSFSKQPLTVVVYVANLSSITASNNATVSTYGNFNTLSLNVVLKDLAVARLNTTTISLKTDISGMASLTLAGSTNEHNAVLGSVAKLNMEKFSSEITNIKSSNMMMAGMSLPKQLFKVDDSIAL